MKPGTSRSRDNPFAKLLELKARREARGHRILDFGTGDPRFPTPEFLRRALIEAIPEVASYPTIRGEADLRQAVAGYLQRRFGVALDPERHVLPVNGSKEGIFTASLALLRQRAQQRGVLVFEPAYPVYAQAARYAGVPLHRIPLDESRGYLPATEQIPQELLRSTALVWLNYPHNPTGCQAPSTLFEYLRERARQYDFILASDECYADLYQGDPPTSALAGAESTQFRNVLAFHSCSKRSAMAGYRTGFVAGDPGLIAELQRARPAFGVATPTFVQAAATAAWRDDLHVREFARVYDRRRQWFLDLFQERGWDHDGGDATFYLWLRVPPGFGDSVQFAERLLQENLLVTPGLDLGETSSRHVRWALVASDEDCQRAVDQLRELSP